MAVVVVDCDPLPIDVAFVVVVQYRVVQGLVRDGVRVAAGGYLVKISLQWPSANAGICDAIESSQERWYQQR